MCVYWVIAFPKVLNFFVVTVYIVSKGRTTCQYLKMEFFI